MRTIQIKIFVAIFTFIIGLAFSNLVSTGIFTTLVKKPNSLCDITERRSKSLFPFNAEKENVNLDGYLYSGKTLTFGDVNLGRCENSIIEVVIADEQKLSLETQAVISEFNNLNKFKKDTANKLTAKAKVNLIGILTQRKHSCFSSRYVVTATQITVDKSVPIEVY